MRLSLGSEVLFQGLLLGRSTCVRVALHGCRGIDELPGEDADGEENGGTHGCEDREEDLLAHKIGSIGAEKRRSEQVDPSGRPDEPDNRPRDVAAEEPPCRACRVPEPTPSVPPAPKLVAGGATLASGRLRWLAHADSAYVGDTGGGRPRCYSSALTASTSGSETGVRATCSSAIS